METTETKSEFLEFVENELNLLAKDAKNGDQMNDIHVAVTMLSTLFESLAIIGGAKSKIILRLFARLASWYPLTPLLGTDDEWEKVGDNYPEDTDILYQNKRCPHIYKRKNGTAFNAEATVFSYDGVVWFRTKDSNEDITFPYEVPVHPKRVMLNK